MLNLNDSTKNLSKKWQLSNIRLLGTVPIFNNYIAIAYSAIYKIDVVLKILIADTHEPEVLKFFDGIGCVKLLDYDDKLKSFLLEHIKPGITLKSLFPLNDARATSIAAEIIKKLHKANVAIPTKPFKTVNHWLELLGTFQSNKIPHYLFQKAQKLSKELLNSEQKQYVLHGDLHHDNVLQYDDQWIAIDPKGVIGPLEYEFGRFIMNPIPDLLKQKNVKEIINNRVNIFSEIFVIEKQRLIDWVFVQAILSACWTEENKNETFFNYFIKFAEIVDDL